MMSEKSEQQQNRETQPMEKGNFLSEASPSSTYNPHLLRYLRETATLTQSALAKEINVDTETVMDWETGRRTPSQKHQYALEKFFRLPAGGLHTALKDILTADFAAAYFGDTAARQRLEWIEKNRKLAHAFGILPIPS